MSPNLPVGVQTKDKKMDFSLNTIPCFIDNVFYCYVTDDTAEIKQKAT